MEIVGGAGVEVEAAVVVWDGCSCGCGLECQTHIAACTPPSLVQHTLCFKEETPIQKQGVRTNNRKRCM